MIIFFDIAFLKDSNWFADVDLTFAENMQVDINLYKKKVIKNINILLNKKKISGEKTEVVVS